MGQFRYLCQVEARQLLWLIGTVFSIVFVVQYFELPYGDALSSLFSAGNMSPPGKTSLPSSDSSSKLVEMGNMTAVEGLNSSNVPATHGVDNNTETMERNNAGPKHVTVVNETLDESFGLDGNGELDSDYASENIFETSKNLTVEKVSDSGDRSAGENASKNEPSWSLENVTVDNNSPLSNIQEDDMQLPSLRGERSGVGSPSPASPQIILSSNTTPLTNLDPHPITLPPERSSVEDGGENTLDKDAKLETSQNDLSLPAHDPVSIPAVGPRTEFPAVTTISEMNDLLLQSHASSHSMVWMELQFSVWLEGIGLQLKII